MPSLPPECLQLIVNYLTKNNELESLTALLLVSKTVCQITLPYIYSNPFGLFEQNITGADAVVKFRQLICLLLTTSIPYGDYSDLLKAMYEIDEVNVNSNIPSRPLKIKYLEYLRHFDLTQELVTLTSPKSETLGTFSRLSQYMEQHGLKQEYRTALEEIPFNRASEDLLPTDSLIISYLNMVLRRELSWVLCHPILDQLQSIAIPVSNLGPYLEAMDCLFSLKSIVFVFDDLLQPSEDFLDSLTEEYIEKSRQIREKCSRTLDLMVEFVQMHTTRFKNRPTELSNTNWAQFIANYHNTDLGHVECITLSNQSKQWYGPAVDAVFLRQCPSLRRLQCNILCPDSFKWAASIRKEIASGVSIDNSALPPLEIMRLRACWEPFGNELEDIALAFGPTLKKLMVFGYAFAAQTSTLQLGYHWNLPFITEVLTYLFNEILDIDPTFLNRCPSLRIISLKDVQDNYRVRDVVTLQPANLPVLFILHLTGTPALSFHPDTLRSTEELRLLVLEHSRAGMVSFVPSITDLEEAEQDTAEQDIEPGPRSQDAEDAGFAWASRPRWTWDWYLPHLKDLVLTGEFDSSSACCKDARGQDQKLGLGPPIINKSQDEWSLQDLEQAMQVIPLESLVAIDSWKVRRSFQPIMYRIHGGKLRDPSHAAELRQHISRGPLLSLIQDQSRIHRKTVEHLDHPQPAVALRHERRERRNVVQSILNEIKEKPHMRHFVVRWIQRVLVTDSNIHVQHTTLPEDIRLRVPSLQVLNMMGRWAISDSVLEILLGQVFRNVRSLQEMYCTGFSVLKWLEMTQQMPWLLRAESRRALGEESVPVEALPESLLTTKVVYVFDQYEYSFAAV
ncbi:hypothetical protein BGZ74_011327 [Mortierella antarctica]|nr:hypothetical protein BGZ74_011327 [Mortierella antarctica]